MLKPSDQEYIATKRIKQGKATLKPEFKALAQWIDQTYDVKTINIFYTNGNKEECAKLEICVEWSAEMEKFQTGNYGNFSKRKQAAIAKQWKAYFPTGNTEELFVCFSAFEPVARCEANEGIPRFRIDDLVQTIGNQNIWKVSVLFHTCTFFLYTDAHVKAAEQNGTKQKWSALYFSLLKEYDEFGYFKEAEFSIYLDSKENLDKNYQGNLYYYYK